MAATKLSEQEVGTALEQLPQWAFVNAKLHREYQFADFIQAFGFMTMSALRIEALNHHPEWMNVYGRVTIDLTTHDAGGVTKKDVELATILESIARRILG